MRESIFESTNHNDAMEVNSITAANQIERIVKLTNDLFHCQARIDLWSDPSLPEVNYVKFIVPGNDLQEDFQRRKNWHRALMEFIPVEANNFSLDIEYQ